MTERTMIERVAPEPRESGRRNGAVVFGNEEAGWRPYIDDARRIITSMHEPTTIMIDTTLGNMNEIDGPEICAEDWRRMIEAALNDVG